VGGKALSPGQYRFAWSGSADKVEVTVSQDHKVVARAEAKLEPRMVRLHPEIEGLVRLLEDTPRERVLEEIAGRVKRGLSYREVLAALFLAGVRNVQPRPVGFKFHAVLVVNSAHLASLAAPDSDRWLPLFWAIDSFKSSQERDVREGDWTMGPVDEAAVGERPHRAGHAKRRAVTIVYLAADLERRARDVDERFGTRIREQPAMRVRVDDDRHEPVLERVASKDVGDFGADHGADPVVEQGPRRVLARGAAAEVVTADEDRGAAVLRPVQREVRTLLAVGAIAPVVEQVLAETVLRRRREISRRDDLVGVDVIVR